MEEIWKDISGFEGLYQVSNFGRVKLTEKDVIIIRALHQEGVDYKILTKVFPVNNATMHKIISNQLWKHLKQAS